jgi:broad specificity phosphatase PhoE
VITLALLRHGHTSWNRDGRLQGRTDMPLDDTARTQLRHLSLPEPWNEAAIWSSPLSRAFETAQLVTGRDPRTHPALIEMNWGDWEGQRRADLFADPTIDYRDIEDWGWHYTPPNGEAPYALRQRLTAWVSSLHGANVAVCHIGVMRVLLAEATGWNFDSPAPFQIKRNRLYTIHIDGDTWTGDPTPVRLTEVAS